jgi:nucleoside-diphosphate-sugar epimerase
VDSGWWAAPSSASFSPQAMVSGYSTPPIEPRASHRAAPAGSRSSMATFAPLPTSEICSTDPPAPGTDPYANQKLAAEAVVQQSRLPWVILRLTYVASPDKLRTDPLMFRMPLDTDLEICTTGDVARAFAAAVYKPAVVGRILDIAGGRACRTTYREYVGTILGMFGLSARDPAATAPFESVLSNTATHEVA